MGSPGRSPYSDGVADLGPQRRELVQFVVVEDVELGRQELVVLRSQPADQGCSGVGEGELVGRARCTADQRPRPTDRLRRRAGARERGAGPAAGSASTLPDPSASLTWRVDRTERVSW